MITLCFCAPRWKCKDSQPHTVPQCDTRGASAFIEVDAHENSSHRLVVSIILSILLVMGSVGFVLVSAGVATYCIIGLGGCSGQTIIGRSASAIIRAWPRILLFLMPRVLFGGAVFLSLKAGKREK